MKHFWGAQKTKSFLTCGKKLHVEFGACSNN